MIKLLSLRSLRLLTLGGAKASTHGFDEGDNDEGEATYYD